MISHKSVQLSPLAGRECPACYGVLVDVAVVDVAVVDVALAAGAAVALVGAGVVLAVEDVAELVDVAAAVLWP